MIGREGGGLAQRRKEREEKRKEKTFALLSVFARVLRQKLGPLCLGARVLLCLGFRGADDMWPLTYEEIRRLARLKLGF